MLPNRARTGAVRVPTAPTTFKVIYAFLFVYSLVVWLLMYGCAAHRRELAFLYNYLYSEYLRLRPREGAKFEKVLLVMYYTVKAAESTGACIVCTSEFLYAWRTYSSSFWKYALVHTTAHFFILMLASWILGLTELFLYLFYVTVRDNFSETSIGASVSIRSGISKYRSLTLICDRFNSSYCLVLVPILKFLTGLLCMMCMHGVLYLKNADLPP